MLLSCVPIFNWFNLCMISYIDLNQYKIDYELQHQPTMNPIGYSQE